MQLQFNDDRIVVELPEEAIDIEGYELLDANDKSRINIPRDWMWIKNIYDITIVEYKAKLSKWNAGTGGGSGLKSMFETWTDEKLSKYDIDPDTYDHTDIRNRPAILMDGYVKSKKYLTCIFLWDEKMEYLISSKYDPLRIGRGEAGMTSNRSDKSLSELSRSTNSPTKTAPSEMATLVNDVLSNVYGSQEKKKEKRKKGRQMICNRVCVCNL